jgi:hypothetical protein
MLPNREHFFILKKLSSKISSRTAISHAGLIAFVAIKSAESAVFLFSRFERQFVDRGAAFRAGNTHRGNIHHRSRTHGAAIILISHLSKSPSFLVFPAFGGINFPAPFMGLD